MAKDRPRTIGQVWDRFYLEFPDVYDRFARSSGQALDAIDSMFGLTDKVVLDVCSGTGRSTFEAARRARLVIGLEPWASMRNFAVGRARQLDWKNVAFVTGVAEEMPLRDRAVDMVISVFGVPLVLEDAGETGRLGAAFVREASRVVRPGGVIVAANTAPGWIREESREAANMAASGLDIGEKVDSLLAKKLGFSCRDVSVVIDYGSVQEAVETYGFIYGETAIDYLTRNSRRTVEWKIRIHYRSV